VTGGHVMGFTAVLRWFDLAPAVLPQKIGLNGII
jgi:hypothetical protein